MSEEKTLVFAPTYNEGGNIERLCRSILDLNPSFHLLIVDDNSPDGTGQILDHLAVFEPRLQVIHRPEKLGLGTAHQLAMRYSIQHNYSQLVTIDADFSHDPADIPRLLAALAEADFVIGSRYAPGGRCDYTGYRLFVSKAAAVSARLLLRIPLYEFTTSYRVFRVDFLKTIDFGRIRSRGYSFALEMVYRAHRGGGRIKEVPVHFTDRVAGRSKIPRLEILNGIWRLLYLSLAQFIRPAQTPPNLDAESRRLEAKAEV